MLTSILSLFALTSGIAAIIFRQTEKEMGFRLMKPLTTIIIMVIALTTLSQTQNLYIEIIFYSLIFSLIGDIFLMYNKYFLHGLVAFLFAHIGFTIAFCSLNGFSFKIIPLVILFTFGLAYVLYLRKHLVKMLFPVMVYMLVIIVMSWQAINLAIVQQSTVFYAVGAGSILFMLSDAIITYNTFVRKFKIAEILILTTYWIAIYIFTMVGQFIS